MTQREKAQAKSPNAPDTHSRAIEEFQTAQQRALSRYGIIARPHFIDVPAIAGKAHVLVVGEGPPLVMVIGGTTPAAFWAPLMAQLSGYGPSMLSLMSAVMRLGNTRPEIALTAEQLTQLRHPWFHRAEEIGALARRFFNDHPDG